jgi:hypothetical protein
VEGGGWRVEGGGWRERIVVIGWRIEGWVGRREEGEEPDVGLPLIIGQMLRMPVHGRNINIDVSLQRIVIMPAPG